MAHYVISDVHGEVDRFQAMLEQIEFSQEDILYILGDVIDRGPGGVEMLKTIMDTPNMHMILGNHEHMCLKYYSAHATMVDIQRWNKNGNLPTVEAMERLRPNQRDELLEFLQSLPAFIDVTVNDRRFYLVHGFPARTDFDRIWSRPKADTLSPYKDRTVIVGHTPVPYLKETLDLEEQCRIFHGPGFIDIDCGCGHKLEGKHLACLRLEDMKEFYC